jgi:hypothetical protein
MGVIEAGTCALCKLGPRGGAELAGKTRGDAATWPGPPRPSE